MQHQPIAGKHKQRRQRPGARRVHSGGQLTDDFRKGAFGHRHEFFEPGPQPRVRLRPRREGEVGAAERRLLGDGIGGFRPQLDQPLPQRRRRRTGDALHAHDELLEGDQHDVVEAGEMMEQVGLADPGRLGQRRSSQCFGAASGHEPDGGIDDLLAAIGSGQWMLLFAPYTDRSIGQQALHGIDCGGGFRHLVGMDQNAPAPASTFAHAAEVFRAFLILGLTSFGGPVAHLGYFRDAFVVRRKWLSEADYADLVALCQFLPGPASSQVGIAIGQMRAGLPGALAAWMAFTLPSVLQLYVVALGADLWSGPLAAGVLHGLKFAALAVVAQAVWQMALRLTPDWPRRAVAVAAAALVLLVQLSATPVVVIALAATTGALFSRSATPADPPAVHGRPHPAALAALVAFVVLLVALPLLAALTHDPALDIADRLYRTGAVVFGGGHVVLPLLQNELVANGLIDRDLFLAGYGAAQAVPGPLFSFAFYAGALLKSAPNGWAGGLLALVAIYLPSALLVLGALPYWERLKTVPRLRAGLDIANAAVVGLLLAALIDPVFTSAVLTPLDAGIAMLALAALFLRVPPWLVVLACGGAGAGLGAIGIM